MIDVGTNSVKLLVGEVAAGAGPGAGAVTRVFETSEQTRLGAGFYESHELRRTARCVGEFVREARRRGATSLRVIATSAAREARNREVLVAALNRASGVPTEVISGEQEAEWGFAGVASNPRFDGQSMLVLDVGGGSTEVILGKSPARPGGLSFRRSFPLGSVRLLERHGGGTEGSRVPLEQIRRELREYFRNEIVPTLARDGQDWRNARAVGIGGSTAILTMIHHACREFDAELIERTELSRELLTALVERLWGLSLAERRWLPGLPPERADVIPFGAAIYEAALREFELPALSVSLRGLRYAALLGESPGGGTPASFVGTTDEPYPSTPAPL